VTLHAAEGGAHPALPSRAHAIHHGQQSILFVVGSALDIGLAVAMKSGGHQVVERGLRFKVSGQLSDGEFVERHIFVHHPNNPVAITPDVAVGIAFVAHRIRVAGQIEPRRRPTFAESGRGKQAVNFLFVSGGRGVLDEAFDLGEARRKSGEVERDAAQELRFCGLWVGGQIVLLHLREHEAIDVAAWPFGMLRLRNFRRYWGLVSPVLFPLGAFFDPGFENLDVGDPQGFAVRGGRHTQFLICRGDPAIEF
jgi:hypothetical protein